MGTEPINPIGLIVTIASLSLLPLIVRGELNGSASDFGLLLGSVGIGAVLGATLLPRIRDAVSPDHLVAGSSLLYALVLAALGQHDAERPRGDLGVVEEQLVEVAHPVEQQHAGVLRLDAQVLLHHRRVTRKLLCRSAG